MGRYLEPGYTLVCSRGCGAGTTSGQRAPQPGPIRPVFRAGRDCVRALKSNSAGAAVMVGITAVSGRGRCGTGVSVIRVKHRD